MPSRKRGRDEMEEQSETPKPIGFLTRLRDTWEFANIMQYIFLFGKALKIDDDFDIDDLENECLKPEPSEKLADIGLCLLKFVSSHRGLTQDNFDEYTRRQYQAKAPARNPFGDEEEPKKFAHFDVFLKLRVLFQLSQWTLLNPDRIRERMPEVKDMEQTQWRVEELGYDRQDRLYYVLDDNRLYRRTDPPPPPPTPHKPKAKSKAGRALARQMKRRKVALQKGIEVDDEEDKEPEKNGNDSSEDSFGGFKWECVAVTREEYQSFMDKIRASRDPNEKVLHERLVEEVMPTIEKQEEEHKKKIARRQKELLNMEKLAHAKRSSRIAGRHEREKQEAEASAAEKKRQEALFAAKKDEERRQHMEEARESRMLTREQRLKEREYKRILHEEELAKMSMAEEEAENGTGRVSERHLKAEIEKKKRALEELKDDEEWVFDCAGCGVHGENIDDGSPSVACDRCNIWQHCACLGISKEDAEQDDFHFVCRDCKRKEEDAKRPKIPTLKFKLGSSSSPPSKTTVQPSSGLKRSSPNGTESTAKKRKAFELKKESGMPPMMKFKHITIPKPVNGAGNLGKSTNGSTTAHPLTNTPTLIPSKQLGPSSSPHVTRQVPSRVPDDPFIDEGQDGTSQPQALAWPTIQNGDARRQDSPSSQGTEVDANGSQSPVRKHNLREGSPELPSPFQSVAQKPNLFLAKPALNTPAPTPPSSQGTGGKAFNTQPLSQTPLHRSSPAMPLDFSSSPVIAPPKHDPRVSGISPVKHSPTRKSLSDAAADTPVLLPPVEKLEPDIPVQDFSAPIKQSVSYPAGGPIVFAQVQETNSVKGRATIEQ